MPKPVINTMIPNPGASGGTTVAIQGMNFVNPSVTFDGVDGAVTGSTATTISVTAPAHAPGNVVVRVTNGDGSGTSDITLMSLFFYQGPQLTSITPASGPTAVGTPVQLGGSQFNNATGVTFGGVAGTGFTVNSANSISVTAPPAAAEGTVDVLITNAGGTSRPSAMGRFTYEPPGVTSVSPFQGPTAGGGTVTINGKNFLGATEVKFGATLATNLAIVNATRITVTCPAHAPGNVDVRVINPQATSPFVAEDRFFFQMPCIQSMSANMGAQAGGNNITLNIAPNASDVSAVYFGAAQAAIVSQTANSIQVTVPAGAQGPVDVILATPHGNTEPTALARYFYN